MKINLQRSHLCDQYGLKHTVKKQFALQLNILSGKIGRKPVVIDKKMSSGKNKTINTQILFGSSPFDFKISQKNVVSKKGKNWG